MTYRVQCWGCPDPTEGQEEGVTPDGKSRADVREDRRVGEA